MDNRLVEKCVYLIVWHTKLVYENTFNQWGIKLDVTEEAHNVKLPMGHDVTDIIVYINQKLLQ